MRVEDNNVCNHTANKKIEISFEWPKQKILIEFTWREFDYSHIESRVLFALEPDRRVDSRGNIKFCT